MCTIHILQRRHEGADASNDGGVAQLGERCVRNAEVGSSILLLSTITKPETSDAFRALPF